MDNKDFPANPLANGADGTPWSLKDIESSTGYSHFGLSKLEYTCIHLGVPKTGDPDLDAVIREGERRRVAAMALQGVLASDECFRDFAGIAKSKGLDGAEVAAYSAVSILADALISRLDTQEGE